MAKIGGRRRLVRAEVAWAPDRKAIRFVTAPRGAHPLDRSLPLLLIIRDKLKLAETAREARKIIKGRKVKVDGKVCRDHKRGIGLFDVLEVAGKTYRMLPVKAGLKLKEVDNKEGILKLCKVTCKVAASEGKIQLGLHDGRSILTEKSDVKPGDSLLVELPSQAVKDQIPLEPGVLAVITYGANAGKLARVKSIERGLFPRAWLTIDNQTFEAPLRAVMPVGKERSVITVA